MWLFCWAVCGKMEKPRKGRIHSERLVRNMMSVLRVKRWRGKKNARKKDISKAESDSPKVIDMEESSTDDNLDGNVVVLQEVQQDITSPVENLQIPEGVTSVNDDKLIKDLPPEAYKNLEMLLQPTLPTGKDYRLLADRLGYSNQWIKWLQTTRQPVITLIKDLGQEGRKITELMSVLNDLGRFDVVEDLQLCIDKTPTQGDIEVRQQTINEKPKEFPTLHESYDAFVCFANNAKKDRKFVEKLIRKMEGCPYKLSLCWTERDFLGGGCYYEAVAEAIKERCNKFIVVLSTSFENSEGALFESHVAMSLSRGAQQQHIIPILMEEAYRYNILRTIAHLAYLDFPRSEGSDNFWERLAKSLGWEPQ